VLRFKSSGLADAQAGAVDGRKHCPVLESRTAVDNRGYFVSCQKFRQRPSFFLPRNLKIVERTIQCYRKKKTDGCAVCIHSLGRDFFLFDQMELIIADVVFV